MRIPMILAGALTTVACTPTSHTGLRERPPRLDVQSSRTVEQVTKCIVEAWSKYGATTHYLPREGGATISLGTEPYVVTLVDLTTTPTGTRVVQQGPYSMYGVDKEKWVGPVAACAQGAPPAGSGGGQA